VDRVALGQVSVYVFWPSPFSIIVPLLHTHMSVHV
jgi:hypothetical protein